jgi:hypothetical protein
MPKKCSKSSKEPGIKHLRVSVVTPVLNNAKTIARTVQSVQSQSYPHIEYLVIDGGSTDGTREQLHRLGIDYISDPAAGQAAAINRGLQMANGEILAWLNADDCYLPGAIASVVTYFQQHPQAQFVYGDVRVIDVNGRDYGRRPYVQATTQHELVHERNRICQPGAFWTRSLWQTAGGLDTSLHDALDYDYWMRCAAQTPLHYLSRCLACECLHPHSKTMRAGQQRMDEIQRIARRHGAADVPRNFYAEAAALSLLKAASLLRTGQGRAAWLAVKRAVRLQPAPGKLMRHLLSYSLPATWRTRAWLMYTRWQNRAT